jgi:hypothetical protein
LAIVRISKKLENAAFRKLDLFPSSGEGKEKSALFDPMGGAKPKVLDE